MADKASLVKKKKRKITIHMFNLFLNLNLSS